MTLAIFLIGTLSTAIRKYGMRNHKDTKGTKKGRIKKRCLRPFFAPFVSLWFLPIRYSNSET